MSAIEEHFICRADKNQENLYEATVFKQIASDCFVANIFDCKICIVMVIFLPNPIFHNLSS